MSRFNPEKLLVVDIGDVGRYAKEYGGHECFNLDKNEIDGKYYGFCTPGGNINMSNIGAENRDDYVDGVLVVYVLKKGNSVDRETVAFCPNARVYRVAQSGENLNRMRKNKKTGEMEICGYHIVSDELIEINKGRLTIPNDDTTMPIKGNTDKATTNRFRQLRFYGKSYPQLAKKITDYIDGLLSKIEMIDDDWEEQTEILQAKSATPEDIQGSADRPLDTVRSAIGDSVKKNASFSKFALEKANYKCQIDSNHETFITAQGKPYMEGHHLIPCTLTNAKRFYDQYGKNIDCVENVICICPTCHRAVHFGDADTKLKMVKAMYAKQSNKLKDAGLPINEEDLLALYTR